MNKAATEFVFVISSLTSGGAERVMTQLANHFAEEGFRVRFIILSRKPHFFSLHPEISWSEPDFTIEEMSRFAFQWKDFWWLRARLKESQGDAYLSFGGKYNAFVLLAGMGLGKRIYISDRSRPSISYGRFLDALNPVVYRYASGIIAQTERARDLTYARTKHPRIQVIPNPIRQIPGEASERAPWIINVGRFISSKHQDWLIDYFEALDAENWNLIFLGDGPQWDRVKKHTSTKAQSLQDRIHFKGNVENIDSYYRRASIFAFTSTSEGFPNALGEAMAAGCACISFDCEAGPADLIDDGVNGFLIPEGDHRAYREKLRRMVQDSDLRIRLGREARLKMQTFAVKKVARNYLEFMLSS